MIYIYIMDHISYIMLWRWHIWNPIVDTQPRLSNDQAERTQLLLAEPPHFGCTVVKMPCCTLLYVAVCCNFSRLCLLVRAAGFSLKIVYFINPIAYHHWLVVSNIWIIFHFIYGMSSQPHWRTPSFFKMGTLQHQTRLLYHKLYQQLIIISWFKELFAGGSSHRSFLWWK